MQSSAITAGFICAALCVNVAVADAQTPMQPASNAPATTPAPMQAQAQAVSGSPERGRQLYMDKFCFACHGTVGQGGERGTGPQIAPSQWPYEAFAQQVRHPRQDMPRYPVQFLKDVELRDIHAYLVTVKPGRAAKDIDLLSNLR